MRALIEDLSMPGVILGFLSPFLALTAAILFYARHSRRVGPEHRLPILAYAILGILAAGAAGYAGMVGGVVLACPESGNLCGLFGIFVTGPIAGLLAVILLGLALGLMRPGPNA